MLLILFLSSDQHANKTANPDRKVRATINTFHFWLNAALNMYQTDSNCLCMQKPSSIPLVPVIKRSEDHQDAWFNLEELVSPQSLNTYTMSLSET